LFSFSYTTVSFVYIQPHNCLHSAAQLFTFCCTIVYILLHNCLHSAAQLFTFSRTIVYILLHNCLHSAAQLFTFSSPVSASKRCGGEPGALDEGRRGRGEIRQHHHLSGYCVSILYIIVDIINKNFILRRKILKQTLRRRSLHIGKTHDQHLEACCRGISSC